MSTSHYKEPLEGCVLPYTRHRNGQKQVDNSIKPVKNVLGMDVVIDKNMPYGTFKIERKKNK